MQFALYFNVLLAVAIEPIEPLLDRRTNMCPPGSSPLRGFRGFDIWCISRSPAASLRFSSSSASAAALSFAGSPSARHIAWVQTWRSSGTSGQPIAGMQHMLLNGGFESVVVRSYTPARIRLQLQRIPAASDRRPGAQLHGAVIDGKCHTQNFC